MHKKNFLFIKKVLLLLFYFIILLLFVYFLIILFLFVEFTVSIYYRREENFELVDLFVENVNFVGRYIKIICKIS